MGSLSALLFTAALLSKQTAVVFIPAFALAYFFRFGPVKSIKGALWSTALFIAVFLPTFSGGNALLFLFETYTVKILGGFASDFVTYHAFNLWALIAGLEGVPDSGEFLFGLSFRLWGFFPVGLATTAHLYLYAKKRAPWSFIFIFKCEFCELVLKPVRCPSSTASRVPI